MKYIILLIIVIAVLYVHYRGRVRYRFWRQLSDHSTFTAPLNGFMYLFSRVPNTPYLRPEMFPELAILQQNWQVIRDEGLHLQQLEQIKAADKYNDAGFNFIFQNRLETLLSEMVMRMPILPPASSVRKLPRCCAISRR